LLFARQEVISTVTASRQDGRGQDHCVDRERRFLFGALGEMLDSTSFSGDLANGVLDLIGRLEQTSKLREQLLTMRKRE